MLRTIAGLNSGLPGDRDVLEQLLTARRIAEYSGTAGAMTQSLIDDAAKVQEQLRSRTEWGRYCTGYCAAALSRIAESADVDFAESRIVVVGGSTTSRSVLGALTESFGVSPRQLTLVYRNRHGGQMKLLRKAIGNGRRLRVNAYTEDAVTSAIADADVVCFGIDTSDPVLDVADIQKRRDLSQRPLTVIDFNTFGAVKNADDVPGVRIWRAGTLDGEVSAFADRLCRGEGFARALNAAESWINERVLDAAMNHTTGEPSAPSVDSDGDREPISCDREQIHDETSLAGSVQS
jgi:glutamyl-tRNA reductase